MNDAESLHALDWWVIGLFLIAMPLVGWYYSRRTSTSDDYLLGGRNMRPLSVGLSLFASLLSTLSYLSIPGEIVRYGPMILGMVAAYPFVYVIVGRWMIPFIMRLPITSAYELLEDRLGLSVRMLGATFFLTMRILWMAVILYATTATVIVPLLGWKVASVPWVCVGLGIVTLAYTSLGGLRAVVMTDVVQSLVLFGGAIATVVIVCMEIGGPMRLIPDTWPTHWPQPEFGLGLGVGTRVTFTLALLAHFTWWISTAGSDQMAVQRYLATRDAKAARTVLAVSLVANALVMAVLGIVGLSLLAYATQRPEAFGPPASLTDNADKLFTRFIVARMPAGLSGLVTAGLLAAAMSSLSSGVNSACSVIQIDFVERRRTAETIGETSRVRQARLITLAVGALVIFLSVSVGCIRGNLLEVVFKVVNLLTAPLFGLFFMAMFIRRAGARSTLLGAAVGLTTVAAINFWPDVTHRPGISFLWSMPLGLLAQISVGYAASRVMPSQSKD